MGSAAVDPTASASGDTTHKVNRRGLPGSKRGRFARIGKTPPRDPGHAYADPMRGHEAEDLFQTLSREILSLARGSRLNPDTASEILSGTLETAWAKRETAPATEAELRRWVMGVARMKIKHERQRVRRKHHDNRFIGDYESRRIGDVDDIADMVVNSSLGLWIWSQMSGAEQQLFRVKFIRGLSNTDAASTLGLSPVALRTRVSRLRHHLDTLLLTSGSDGP